MAFQQFQLEVEAHHDMEIVGDLVGIRADQRAFNLVDRAVEGLEPCLRGTDLEKYPAEPGKNAPRSARPRPTTFSQSRDWLSCTPADVPVPSGVPSSVAATPCS